MDNECKDVDIGKFSRILLCACGSRKDAEGSDWVRKGLGKESVVVRVGGDEE